MRDILDHPFLFKIPEYEKVKIEEKLPERIRSSQENQAVHSPKKSFSRVSVAIIIGLLSVILVMVVIRKSVYPPDTINWQDKNLKKAMREITGITDRPITYSDLSEITELDLSGKNIRNISALAGLSSLTELFLYENQITDISALAGLSSLTELSLGLNQIADISALEGLSSLTYLDLYDNQITDVSALAGLSSLTELSLFSNQITEISALSNLQKLTHLNLWNNPITDYSPIEDLHIEELKTS